MDYIKGIDVSHWQGNIDWPAVKKAGYKFAIIKISGGDSGLYTDSKAIQNVQGAKNAGLMVGGYHYAYYKTMADAQRETTYFKSVIRNMGLKWAVLDIEYPNATGDLTAQLLAFLDNIADIVQPVLYASPSFIRSHLSAAVTKYPLWIAHYNVSKPSVPLWCDWAIWQYTSTGSVPGIKGNVDINYMKPDFIGDDEMLDKLIILNKFDDIGAGYQMSIKEKCPMITREIYDISKPKAKKYIVIGGTWVPDDGESELISGTDGKGTFKAVANKL